MHVSVIVPCFNHERFVARCLKSIDSQGMDLEVIVVDDGSTDASWNWISAFKWRPSHVVQLVHTENRGAHAALNHGLGLASGDYVALCNSDDCFGEHRLETMIGEMRKADRRFSFSQVRFIDSAGDDVSHSWEFARDLASRQREIRDFPSVGFALTLTNVAISTGNFLFERSLLREIGFFRPYRYCHDWDFILRALLHTEPLFVGRPLYEYRLHPKNSFRDLQEAAGVECPELMRRYMKAAITGRYPNPLAPSPRNWPGFFEYFIEEHDYQPYLVGWEDIDGVYFEGPGSPAAVPVVEAAG